MPNPITWTTRCDELEKQIRSQIVVTWISLEINRRSSDGQTNVKVRTDTPNTKVGWLLGKGSTIEEALEDYAHGVAVRLDG